LTYFLSQNTIHSTSRELFIRPAEQPWWRSLRGRLSLERGAALVVAQRWWWRREF
jgi:hypothetical protein